MLDSCLKSEPTLISGSTKLELQIWGETTLEMSSGHTLGGPGEDKLLITTPAGALIIIWQLAQLQHNVLMLQCIARQIMTPDGAIMPRCAQHLTCRV